MPFLVIRGTFHVVGKNKKGQTTGFQPDGDSIQFRPRKTARLDQLKRRKRPYRLSGIKSVNLRFEGIDASELHYQGWRQPAPLAESARDFLLQEIGITKLHYRANGVTVVPPAEDGQDGFILAKELEANGRPVSFVFCGDPPDDDGAEVTLTRALLRRSLNYRLLQRGWAYPLYYDSLYAELREEMTAAARTAAQARAGVWQTAPTTPVRLAIDAKRKHISPTVYPKLFRRLRDYFADGNSGLNKFAAWMESRGENDEVWQLPQWNRTHFDNVLVLQGGKIALERSPADLVFVSR